MPVLLAVLWRVFAKVRVTEVVGRPELPGEEPTAERTVGDDSYTQFPTSFEETDTFAFDLKRKGRVLELDGRDRMDLVGAPECFG